MALNADGYFLTTGRLLADAKTNPQYGLLNKPVSYDKNVKLPTSDPVAVDAMIEKRTKMAEALRKQGLKFIGYGKDADGNKVPQFEAIEGFSYMTGSFDLLP